MPNRFENVDPTGFKFRLSPFKKVGFICFNERPSKMINVFI